VPWFQRDRDWVGHDQCELAGIGFSAGYPIRFSPRTPGAAGTGMLACGHAQFHLPAAVRKRQRKDACSRVIDLQVVPQSAQFPHAWLKRSNRSLAAHTLRREDCVDAIVAAGIEEGHSRLQDMVEKGELIGLHASGYMDPATHIVPQKKAEACAIVPGHRKGSFALSIVEMLPGHRRNWKARSGFAKSASKRHLG